MTVTDAGLSFWLRYVDATGGLVEENGDTTLVVLPEDLQRQLDLPEELQVTADPDVARDAGVTFLGAGHPALGRSADEVLAIGDVAAYTIAAPAALPPSVDHLQDAARDQFTVEHGRIDASGSVTRGIRPILRVGAIVDYTLSTDDRYQEVAECWIDATSLRPIATSTTARLARCDLRPTEVRSGDLIPAVGAADRHLDHAATRRRAELGSDVDKALAAELNRVESYYRDQLAQIARRAKAAPPDRRELYDARAESTRGEHARRLAETREKYRASHTIRPFRLHLMEVPVWRVPVDVRRGDRRYPLTLDYLMPVGAFAEVPCPNCGSDQTLVATKSRLGCTACQVRAVQAPPPPPRAPKPAKPTQPKPAKPTQPEQSTPQPPVAKRRPPVQPRQPSPEKVGRIGDKLVTKIWSGVTKDDDRLALLCADGSPAAAAVRLFGGRGLGYAIGLPVGDVPCSVDFQMFPDEPELPQHCAGMVGTAGGWQFPFTLRWSATGPSGSVEEVLPYARPFPGGQLFPGGEGVHSPPEPRAPLGPVGETLWRRTLSEFGLSVTLRCLAALWRLPDESALAAAHGPTAIAAGLERMICMRAGIGRGHFAEVAAAFRVTERVVRRVDADLQARLRLGSETFW